MSGITVKILYFILAVFFIVSIAHQVTVSVRDGYKTEAALLYSSEEKISFHGVYIRDEKVINSTVSGVFSYPFPDGGKIAKDSAAAYVYKNAEAIDINRKINDIEDEISRLESMQNPGTADVAQPEFIANLIDEKYRSITSMTAKSDLSKFSSERKEFQTLLGIYQIAIGEETDYNARISILRQELEELKLRQEEPSWVVTAPDSGYFISYTDGYEEKLRPESLDRINEDLLREIIDKGIYSARQTKYSAGKLVSGYNWYMAGLIDTSDHDIRQNSKVRLKFSSTPDIIEVDVKDIRPADSEGLSIVVLSADKLTYSFVQRRVERVELLFNEHNGIKVPREAVRFNRNNEKGVYVLLGEKVQFKKVDTLFEGNDYLLSAVTSDAAYVSVYDDIIISGDVNFSDISESETEPSETGATSPETGAAGILNENTLPESGSGEIPADNTDSSGGYSDLNGISGLEEDLFE